MQTVQLKNAVTKIQCSVEVFKSKMKRWGEKISKLKDRAIEITQFEKQREYRLRK